MKSTNVRGTLEGLSGPARARLPVVAEAQYTAEHW